MEISTRHFGVIDVEEDKIISFPLGIPGFDDKKEFILLSKEEEEVFFWLQCVDDPTIAFAVMDILKVLPDYDPLISMEDLKIIDIQNSQEDMEKIISYNIVVVPENIEEMRVNLKAPIVINADTFKGRQVLASNDDLEVGYKIFHKLNLDK